jgi:ribonuclease HII
MQSSQSSTVETVNQETSSKSLSRSLEKSVASGFDHIIGLDEAGRGPLAGPVVAAACYLPDDSGILPGIADSKLLSEDDREKAFAELESNPLVQYAYCVVSHTEIDELNILQASMTAMSRSTSALLAGMGIFPESAIHVTTTLKPSLVSLRSTLNGKGESKKSNSFSGLAKDQFLGLVDGNRIPSDLPIEGRFVIQGDRKIYSIAAASIIAKVVRDRIMVELDKKYPQYLFAQHKGYPTFAHRSLLLEHGPCEVHRKTYGPVKIAIEAHSRKDRAKGTKGVAVSNVAEETTTSKKRKRASKMETDIRVDEVLPKKRSNHVLAEAKEVPTGLRRSSRLAGKLTS